MLVGAAAAWPQPIRIGEIERLRGDVRKGAHDKRRLRSGSLLLDPFCQFFVENVSYEQPETKVEWMEDQPMEVGFSKHVNYCAHKNRQHRHRELGQQSADAVA